MLESTDRGVIEGSREEAKMKKAAAKVAEAPPPPPEPSSGPKLFMTSRYHGRTLFVCVGAGGTGARVIPPLTQMMRPGDGLAIVDPDIVEDRNLTRQHFTSRDIGRHKALVLAERYQRDGIQIRAFSSPISTSFGTSDLNMSTVVEAFAVRRAPIVAIVLIGCVDNAAARRAMEFHLSRVRDYGLNQGAWIDGGNDMRGGQVLMNLRFWPMKLVGVGTPPEGLVGGYHLNGISAMPQLLRDEATPTPSCGAIDLQTVQANLMSASGILNQISILLNGLTTSNAGVFFSTLNSMSPIKLDLLAGGMIYPEKSFAVEV